MQTTWREPNAKASCQACWLFSQLLKKEKRDEDQTKIHSFHHCRRYRAFRILGKGGRPVRDSHSQKHIVWIRKVSLSSSCGKGPRRMKRSFVLFAGCWRNRITSKPHPHPPKAREQALRKVISQAGVSPPSKDSSSE